MKRVRPILYFTPGLLLVLLVLLLMPLPAAHASSGTWTTTGSMSESRFDHTATLLPNGKVLVAGAWAAAHRRNSTIRVVAPGRPPAA